MNHGHVSGLDSAETRAAVMEADTMVSRVLEASDIHPTVMHILGLEPGRPVDGRVEHRLLRERG